MSNRTHSVLSLAVLVLGAAACRSGAPPSSNTPATAEASSPAQLAAASSTASSDTNGASGSVAPGTVDEAGHAAPPGPGTVVTDDVPADTRTGSPSGATAVTAASSEAADAPASGADPATPLTDPQIAAITDGVNNAEIEQAKLAKEKSKDPQVRRFATMMIEHHGAAQKKQAALKLETEQSPLSQELAQDAQNTLESLKTTTGPEFDRAYMTAQVEGHQKVLATLQRELRPGAQEPALKRYLSELEPQVSRHLEQARKTEAALQAKDTASSGKTSSR